MKQGPSSPDVLDDILTRTRHLLLSFDGPICPLSVHTPSIQITDQLRATLSEQDIALPSEIKRASEWREMLTYAAAISQQLVQVIEAELTRIESAAALTLRPTLHLHEVATACRDSGHSLSVIGDISVSTIRAYLAENSLDGAIPIVIARAPGKPVAAKQSHIEQAAGERGIVPEVCAVLTSTPTDIDAARNVGASCIGYTSTDKTTEVRADATVSSLADLALSLRRQRPKLR
jgi:beta-phosphoglucomutase-like phosphatase (HAD superfamily)